MDELGGEARRERFCAGDACGCDEVAQNAMELACDAVCATENGDALRACELLHAALCHVAENERNSGYAACPRAFQAIHTAKCAARAVRELVFIRFGAMLDPSSHAQRFCGNPRCEPCSLALKNASFASKSSNGIRERVLTESDPVLLRVSATLCGNRELLNSSKYAVVLLRLPALVPESRPNPARAHYCRSLGCMHRQMHQMCMESSGFSRDQHSSHGIDFVSRLGAPVCTESISAARKEAKIPTRTVKTGTDALGNDGGSARGVQSQPVAEDSGPTATTSPLLSPSSGNATRNKRDSGADNQMIFELCSSECCVKEEGAGGGMSQWPAYWVYPEENAEYVRTKHWSSVVSVLQSCVLGGMKSWQPGIESVFVEADHRLDVAYVLARVAPTLGLLLVAPPATVQLNPSKHQRHSLLSTFTQATQALFSVLEAVPTTADSQAHRHSDHSEDAFNNRHNSTSTLSSSRLSTP
eukprot:CAMPEP_0185844934 /NCGR_PEP_ID=MMETSP1354-20130828/1023_1 /TAXON_ID=708628 /ORGANISM="Erythrolobus madagascarensis, Strain CCMP3276" /LENGTH=470 /DNA_ID=CAMNT_0028544769 /DNA_START=208 /DNA_END=1616 /DNA_ORIENTATION=-